MFIFWLAVSHERENAIGRSFVEAVRGECRILQYCWRYVSHSYGRSLLSAEGILEEGLPHYFDNCRALREIDFRSPCKNGNLAERGASRSLGFSLGAEQ